MSDGSTPKPLGRVFEPSDLGTLIRARRRQLHLTQVECAALVGVAPRFLGELEHGKATAQLGLTLRVAARLGLDVWVATRGWRP